MKARKLKGIVALVLVFCMMFAFTGCGEKKAGDDGVTVVTFWSPSPHSKATYTKLVDEFNATTGKEKGIKIVYEIKEGDIGQQLELALASDQAPDLFVTGNIAQLAEKGQIAAIEDLGGCGELLEKYKDICVSETNTYNGKTYTIPIASTTRALVYNKDMFKNAGLVDENGEPTPPKTWDELREYAKKLTDASKKEYGIILPMKWSGWFDSDIISAAIPSLGHKGYDYKTGKFDYSDYKPIFDTYLGIKEDKSFVPGAESLDNDPARARFSEGGVGMKFAHSFDVAVFNDQFPAKIDWGVAPLPVLDVNGKQYKQPVSYGSSARINAKSLETVGKEKLSIVYNWFYSDEVIATAYKDSLNIPALPEIVRNTKIDNPKKGWTEFAAMLEESALIPNVAKYDISGESDLASLFINEVWSGKSTSDEVIAKFNNVINKGVERYKEVHPNYDITKDIYPNWEISK